jgi:hypothetical protein
MINVSNDVLLIDIKSQTTPTTQGMVANLKPNKLSKSPFTASSRSSSNARQLQNTDIVLASYKPFGAVAFNIKLVAVSKPAEIGLIPFSSFNPDCALWPSNRCADIFFI